MEQYIPKSSLVAEIEKRIEGINPLSQRVGIVGCSNTIKHLRGILSFINSLEVKEVDLEKEYEEFVVDDPIFGNFITNDTMGMEFAKHFFELGLKAQKGE